MTRVILSILQKLQGDYTAAIAEPSVEKAVFCVGTGYLEAHRLFIVAVAIFRRSRSRSDRRSRYAAAVKNRRF